MSFSGGSTRSKSGAQAQRQRMMGVTASSWPAQLATHLAESEARWTAAGADREAAAGAWAWHGTLGDGARWEPPRCVCASDALARPGYDSVDASEFLDAPPVLLAKVELLASLIERSHCLAAYTGAGISTAAGIGDYASRGAGTMAKRWQGEGPHIEYLKALKPTLAHRVLAALARKDAQPRRAGEVALNAPPLKAWVQQNHDGLAFKAACPPHIVNEIHGSWFDSKNPVVMMSGDLRRDLRQRMERTARTADLTLACGTSLCGLFADKVATHVAHRARAHAAGVGALSGSDSDNDSSSGSDEREEAEEADAQEDDRAAAAEEGGPPPLGLVIINLQRTAQDCNAALRIFATLDVTLGLLARRLGLTLPGDEVLAQAQAKPFAWYRWMYEPSNKATTRETTNVMRRRCGYKKRC